jgi:hypothetical protein
MKLGGIQTLFRMITLPDGSQLRAGFACGTPIVEYFPVYPPTGGARDTVMQGFVVHPRSTGSVDAFGDFPDVLLINEGAVPIEDSSYTNLFYDETYFSSNPTTPQAGLYTSNRDGQVVFSDGLQNLSGNVDWRNSDESFVIYWGGASDRYFGVFGAGFFPGQKCWINGDEIVDVSGQSGITSDDIVVGACLHTGLLVIAVARERQNGSTPSRLRIYTAPLKPLADDELSWLGAAPAVSVLRRPRFTAVAADEYELRFEYEFDAVVRSGICDGPPLCFNQSATEGRMMLRYRVASSFADPNLTIRELIIDISDLEDVTLDVDLRAESPYSEYNGSFTNTVGRMAAFEVKTGSPAQQEWMGDSVGSDSFAYITNVEYDETLLPRTTWMPVAVDYKGDEPVYAYFRGPERTTTGEYVATPGAVFTATAGGYEGVGTTTIDHTLNWTEIWGGLRLPWQRQNSSTGVYGDFEILCEGYGSQVSHTDGEATADDSAGTGAALTLGTTGTWTEEILEQHLVIFHLDLRVDTVAFGIREAETLTDEGITWTKTGTDGSPNRKIDTTRNNSVTTRLRTVVNVYGVDEIDSGMVEVYSTTTTSPTSSTAFIGIAPETAATSREEFWVLWGWHSTHAWETTLLSFNNAGYYSTVLTDDTAMQALIDAMPIDPFLSFSDGTYDLSGVDAQTALPDRTVTPANSSEIVGFPLGAMEDAGLSSAALEGPFDELYGASNPMSWGEVFPEPGGTGRRRVVGAFCPDRAGNFAYTIALPILGGGTELWVANINNEDGLDYVTGEHGADVFVPIWLTTRFCYEHKTG